MRAHKRFQSLFAFLLHKDFSLAAHIRSIIYCSRSGGGEKSICLSTAVKRGPRRTTYLSLIAHVLLFDGSQGFHIQGYIFRLICKNKEHVAMLLLFVCPFYRSLTMIQSVWMHCPILNSWSPILVKPIAS